MTAAVGSAGVKIIKAILIGLVALVTLLAVVAFILPRQVHVERVISIAAPPQSVFGVVNSLKRFNEWSPWFEIDPETRFTYSGADQGVGARLQWSSKSPELGTGAQEIVESEPGTRVRTRLEFEDERTAFSELRLTPDASGTHVTWAFNIDFGFNLPGRYFGLFLDRVLGPYYEKGLANLKVVAEAEATATEAPAPVLISEAEVPAIDIAYMEGITALDPAAIAKSLDTAYATINAFLKANGLEQSGARLAINRFYDESGWGFEAAIPFSGSDQARSKAASAGSVKIGKTYGGRVIKGVHIGPHSTLPETYGQLEDHMAQQHLEPNGRSWEQYVGDPGTPPPEKLETHVFMPIKSGP